MASSPSTRNNSRQDVFVTKWNCEDLLESMESIKVHSGRNAGGSCFELSSDGFYLVVGTGDGYTASINTRYLQIDRKN